jgi:hypothetical protein
MRSGAENSLSVLFYFSGERLETRIVNETRLKHRSGVFIALLLGSGEFTETGNRAFQRRLWGTRFASEGNRAVGALSCSKV